MQQPKQTRPNRFRVITGLVDVDLHENLIHAAPSTGEHTDINTTEILNQVNREMPVLGEHTDVVHVDHQGVHSDDFRSSASFAEG